MPSSSGHRTHLHGTEILARYGKTYGWELKSRLMGCRDREAAEILIRETGISMTADEYLSERTVKQESLFAFAKPLPGVLSLIKHLKDTNIPIIVATSSCRATFLLKAKNNHALFSLFDNNIVCGDDPKITRGKPAPDIFHVARERLGSPPANNCLVFEDAINGVEAAKNAEMNVIWVPHPALAAIHKDYFGATETLTSLEHFDPRKYGLPPFPDDEE
ncbi:8231_t:CDS:2 [Paraglomus brasilianum]|uniref:8231_t:CDS:1 n=1 Tax=Paraglomus brasilianum TaxID=144538 RepID=A0A9N9BP69_9GLOM|nr:8231_t:CDS:2 [Paraglomus brasilianum]